MMGSNGVVTVTQPHAAFDVRLADPGAPGWLMIGTADKVQVLAFGGDAEGRDADTAASIESLATLLERAAAALRGSDAGAVQVLARDIGPAAGRPPAASDRFVIGELEVHPATRLVMRRGQPVPLSRIEFDLFLALLRRDGRPCTRLELVREVWGYGAAVTSRSVDTQIYNLRHKLEENPSTPRHLLTVSGVGYRLAK